ncbi:hypothetical protein B8V81_3134 [Paenibacillus pasadenensis]|uniref:Uncharacterized protein n=1 Tax=Paenibacillus pasadenensis TaxID=217090 RepID=A0A2N5N306_9BACL|nr:hypothetical protein B8V81_3134 [Paenibacillus pasadenensis]
MPPRAPLPGPRHEKTPQGTAAGLHSCRRSGPCGVLPFSAPSLSTCCYKRTR